MVQHRESKNICKYIWENNKLAFLYSLHYSSSSIWPTGLSFGKK